MTVTGIAADATLAGGPGSKLGRRGLSIAAMLLGALIGGLLVLRVDNAAPLALATGLLALDITIELPRVPLSGRVGAFRYPGLIVGQSVYRHHLRTERA